MAFDEAAAQAEVKHPDDASSVERKCPRFELPDAPGSKRGADHRAHRATCHEIGRNALLGECAKYPDMRPAARRAAAKRYPERGSLRHCSGSMHAIIRVRIAAICYRPLLPGKY
jgi:hypothetical protein